MYKSIGPLFYYRFNIKLVIAIILVRNSNYY